jgi:CBS domain-containing protein
MIKAKDIMTTDVMTISPDATLADAIELLITREISGMPVIDGEGKIIGILTEKDILNFAFSGNLRNTKVKEAMSSNITTFSPETDINTIALDISHHPYRRVPIVENGKVVGIIARRDIIKKALNIC